MIGRNTVIHPNCTLTSCYIGKEVVIGARSVVMEGARIEKGAMLAPGTVVPPGRLIPSNTLWAGNPCTFVKELNVAELWSNYSLSYVHSGVADTTKHHFSLWPNNYLDRPVN